MLVKGDEVIEIRKMFSYFLLFSNAWERNNKILNLFVMYMNY